VKKFKELGNGAVSLPKAATFEGNIYRSVKNGYDPLEMNSYTIRSNHRYTQPGTEGLYFSTGERIVEAELASYKTVMSGRKMYSYDVKLNNMLDLSNPKVRSKLGVQLDDLLSNNYKTNIGNSVTHKIGEFAKQNGYNGILAPSARADGGLNVIVFDPKLIK